jgi:hypothetical protein
VGAEQRFRLLPEEIAAGSGMEFRMLLKVILERSGLRAGQISCHSGIARSQVYSLVSSTRSLGLPTKPEQVHRFLDQCRLAFDQIVQVMELWAALKTAERG